MKSGLEDLARIDSRRTSRPQVAELIQIRLGVDAWVGIPGR